MSTSKQKKDKGRGRRKLHKKKNALGKKAITLRLPDTTECVLQRHTKR